MITGNNNSPIAAALAIIGVALSAWWLGIPGVVVYVGGFAIAGFGTIVNMKRSGRGPWS